MSVKQNIEQIEERIIKACGSAGRKREEITLMGVSKFVPLPKIKEAAAAGIKCFGESRVQEAAQKFAAQKFAVQKFASENTETFRKDHPDISIHMIGTLQRNKARTAVSLFDCIQSIDRQELITELAKHADKLEKPLEILLELHTGEESKSGFADFDCLFKAADYILSFSCLKPIGLMTMAPYFEDMSQPDSIKIVRSSFKQLVSAKNELEKRFPPGLNCNWDCLSMGMSNDFEIAIEEGSTMLRVGSLIFKD